jgi:uncharacterized protein YeaO (DUF488 family)
MIQLKRVYDAPSDQDHFRILVERLWPRGVSKSRAQIDLWLKEIAPSPDLREWYSHDLSKWGEFQERYAAELRLNPAIETMQQLLKEKGTLTFVYAARDEEHNSAVLLKAFLEREAGTGL